jgi:hypothetical protein
MSMQRIIGPENPLFILITIGRAIIYNLSYIERKNVRMERKGVSFVYRGIPRVRTQYGSSHSPPLKSSLVDRVIASMCESGKLPFMYGVVIF